MDNSVITFREISQAIFHRNFPFSDETKCYEPDSPEMVKLKRLYEVGPDFYSGDYAKEEELMEFFLDNPNAVGEVLASLRERIKNIPDDEKTEEKIQAFRQFRLSGHGFFDGPEKWPARDYWVLNKTHEWLQPLFWDGIGRAHRKEIAQAKQTEKAAEPAAADGAADGWSYQPKREIIDWIKSHNGTFRGWKPQARQELDTIQKRGTKGAQIDQKIACGIFYRAYESQFRAAGRSQKQVYEALRKSP